MADKEVVPTEDDVMDPAIEISLDEAREVKEDANVGDIVEVEVQSSEFGRMAAQTARNVITQAIREEEKNIVFRSFRAKEKDIITGIIKKKNVSNISQKQLDEQVRKIREEGARKNKSPEEIEAEIKNIKKTSVSYTINLGTADAILTEKEMVFPVASGSKDKANEPNESYEVGKRMKFLVLKVENGNKGPRILVSRTHPDLVKRLFEAEVSEINDGTVEIMSIAREPGSRTKMAVVSHNENVDPVGSCVGVNGARVNAVVRELNNEKIDIIIWDENPGNFIRNALSPAQIVNVFADPEEKTANVVVPDDQLSLAIGNSGQNARLAAKLTNYKIDIKSETQAKDAYGFRIEDYMDDDDEYDEDEEMNFEEPDTEVASEESES
ncbi:MAG: transcription termination factor NusA [Lachnospiraceae bacterium]|nr:transcription termination factor NusA [Lachnospiraceae bacterium]